MSPHLEGSCFAVPDQLKKPILSSLDLEDHTHCVNYLLPNQIGMGFEATLLAVGRGSGDPFAVRFLERDRLGIPTKVEISPNLKFESNLGSKDSGIVIRTTQTDEGRILLRAEDQYGRKQAGFFKVNIWDETEEGFMTISPDQINGEWWQKKGQAHLERVYQGGLLIVPRFSPLKEIYVLPTADALDSKSKAAILYRLGIKRMLKQTTV